MLSKELISQILSSVWCTLPATWDYALRSNRIFKVLDLTYPGIYGIHVAYNLLSDYVNYVLITVPADTDVDAGLLDIMSDVFNSNIDEDKDAKRIVFYRKEFEKQR